MELSLLSILGGSLPSTGVTDDKAGTSLPTATNVIDGVATTEPQDLRARFAKMLELAESRFRETGKQRVAVNEVLESKEALDNIHAFRRMIDDLGKEVIAGIMPVMQQPLQDTGFQESFVAAIAFHGIDAATTRGNQNSITGDVPLSPEEQIAQEALMQQQIQSLPLMEQPVLPSGSMEMEIADRLANDSLTDTMQFNPNDIAGMPVDSLVTPSLDEVVINNAGVVQSATSLLSLPIAGVDISPIQENILNNNTPLQKPDAITAPLWTATAIATPPRTISHPVTERKLAETPQLSALIPQAVGQDGEALPDDILSVTTLSGRTGEKSATPHPLDAVKLSPELFKRQVEDSVVQPSGLLSTLTGNAPAAEAGKGLHFHHQLAEQPDMVKLVVAEPNRLLNMTPSQQVSVHILQASNAIPGKITLQLYPEELGKVEVHMQIDKDNNTIMKIIAESRDSYDILRADRAGLERILQDSGLKLDSNQLQFSHKGQEQSYAGQQEQGQQQQSGTSGTMNRSAENNGMVTLPETIPQEMTISLLATTGVNIRV